MEKTIERYVQALAAYDGPPLRLMEVCGTHTHQLSALGIPAMLSPKLTLLSGPGCPVCVTPGGYIDRAAELSLQPRSTVLSFGDMLRVPGYKTSLVEAKAKGGSIRILYSPLEALRLAADNPDHMFYVAAVGFETTLPLYGLLLRQMRERNLRNIRLLTAVKALMPALHWISAHNPDVQGFLGPGHVSSILGWGVYEPFCRQAGLPLAVAGFQYEHLIAALFDLVRQNQQGTAQAHNLYPGAVTREGNPEALSLIQECFTLVPSAWRGLGAMDQSGYALSPTYAEFDAGAYDTAGDHPSGCLCASVITGRASPVDCACFGNACTPQNPLGPCMVSSEGTCGIWHATARTR